MEDLNAATTAFLNETKKAVDCSFSDRFVLPGEKVTQLLTKTSHTVKLGSGLNQIGDEIVVCNAGVLRYRPPNRFWIDFNSKRYIPNVDDGVIGIVEDRNAEFYRVNIGAASNATLDLLAFDGASKRNRPNLQKGALVYARVLKTSRHMAPVLTCEALPGTTKKDWMTGLGVYGELSGGYPFKCSIGLAKTLLKEDCVVLLELGKRIPFELAVGLNGNVWVLAENSTNIILVVNAILNSESLSDVQTELMVEKIVESVK